MPVWGWSDLIPSVGGLPVQGSIAIPGDAFVRHPIRSIIGVLSGDVEQGRAGKGVVEERIGNQPTGIVGEIGLVQLQGFTVARPDGCLALGHEFPLELILIERFHVVSMVLIEIGETIVQEYGRADGVGNVEFERADVGLVFHPWPVGDLGDVGLPSGWVHLAAIGDLEGALNLARWDRRKGALVISSGSLTDTIGVVDDDLLDLEMESNGAIAI